MEEKLRLLYSWIESWHQDDGYGGFLHHAIHGTVNWYHTKLVPSYTYEPLMNGFINLYNSTENKIWLDKAEHCAFDLMQILDDANQFKYSGFEFAPKGGSIVHTVNPLFSFMKLYEITGKKLYLNVVKNVLESVVCIYWKGYNLSGPFNMTLIVAAAFAEYGRITGDWRLHDKYGKECFELAKRHKVGIEGGEAEGLYYRNEDNHSIIFPWYNTVKAIAMLRYGRAIGDNYWENEGLKLLETLHGVLLEDYTFPHSFQNKNGEYVKYDDVRLIAPVALAITWMRQEGVINECESYEAMSYIMNTQQVNGFIPANYGYDWRSYVGVTAWNCFVFEMLTTKYQLCDDSLVQIPEYMHDIGDVLICENLKSFSLSFRGEKIYEVDKKTGAIIRNTISGIPDFSLKKDCLQYLPYVVRINAQRHYAVSFIDDNGNGVWLETNEGDLAVWSPYSNLTISHDYSIYNKGVQKYDKFGSILYCILKPFVYNKICVNLAMKILHR